MDISPDDLRALKRDKYDDDPNADMRADIERLDEGEPLAYVIGWIPFLGTRIDLASRPLIPRAETEWWVEQLIAHLKERYGTEPFTLLDLCAGSGAIGIAVLKALPNVSVTFVELIDAHCEQIAKNVLLNGIDPDRAHIVCGDLFAPVQSEQFDIIATNPPYVPSTRTLPESVTAYEPAEALYAEEDGLSVIRSIAAVARDHFSPDGELWLECDSEHAQEVQTILCTGGATRATINPDQYGRPRTVVAYYE